MLKKTKIVCTLGPSCRDEEILERMLKAGMKDISMKLYPGLRHDLFREDERKEIFEYIYQWIEDRTESDDLKISC